MNVNKCADCKLLNSSLVKTREEKTHLELTPPPGIVVLQLVQRTCFGQTKGPFGTCCKHQHNSMIQNQSPTLCFRSSPHTRICRSDSLKTLHHVHQINKDMAIFPVLSITSSRIPLLVPAGMQLTLRGGCKQWE